MLAAASALAVTTAIQVTTAMAALALPAIAPAVAHDLGMPTSLVGTYISLLYVGASAAALVGGGLVRRVGAIRLSQACLLLAGAGLLLGLTPWVALLALGALVLGTGYGPITPASNHVLAHAAPGGHQALFLSIRQSGVPAGTALAGLVVPPLALAIGWHGAIAAVALACFAMAGAAQPLRRRLDADRDRGARVSLAQVGAGMALVATTPTLRVLAAVSFVYAGMQMCATTFMVAYLNDELGWSLVAAGTGLTAASVAGVVARIVWGAVADRLLSPHATLTLLGGLMAGASLALALSQPQWAAAPVLAVCAALGATAIGWNGVYMAEIVRVAPPGRAAVATGGCLFFTFVGVVILPFLFGVLQRAGGSYAICFAAAAGLCAAMAIVLALRGDRRG
jgi:MFS family permease